MLNDKTLGVRIPDTKTFYYIEAGDNWIGNTVDRIKKTLIQRNVIKTSYDGKTTPYDVCTYLHIKQNNSTYNVEPIFLSKHIEALYKASNNVETDSKGIFKS